MTTPFDSSVSVGQIAYDSRVEPTKVLDYARELGWHDIKLESRVPPMYAGLLTFAIRASSDPDLRGAYERIVLGMIDDGPKAS